MDTMSDAVEDLKDKANNNNDILAPPFLLTELGNVWGYCSLNGIVTTISVETERL